MHRQKKKEIKNTGERKKPKALQYYGDFWGFV